MRSTKYTTLILTFSPVINYDKRGLTKPSTRSELKRRISSYRYGHGMVSNGDDDMQRVPLVREGNECVVCQYVIENSHLLAVAIESIIDLQM